MRIPDHAFNRLTVLKKLRAAEPVSRTELAHLSDLTGGSITAIVGDLVKRGLVLEEKVPSPNRGRPKVNLRINPDGAYVAGATLTSDGRIVTEIVDLKGESVFAHTGLAKTTTKLPELAGQFAHLLGAAIKASPIPLERIAQIGVGIPAIVDSQTGIVKYFATFDPEAGSFAGFIERQLGIPVRIDNNNNLLARAVHWFGESKSVDDFTMISIGLGLGSAQYQAGQLMIGSHGIEAEMGHTKIVPEDGRPCHCGALGCLEAYGSIGGIVGQYCEQAGIAATPYELVRSNRMFDLFGELVEGARGGNEKAITLFRRAGRYLGIGVANHINMQDPDRIVVFASNADFVELVSEPFFESLHENTLPPLRNLARVTFRPLDELNYSRGAAAMILEQLYLTQ